MPKTASVGPACMSADAARRGNCRANAANFAARVMGPLSDGPGTAPSDHRSPCDPENGRVAGP